MRTLVSPYRTLRKLCLPLVLFSVCLGMWEFGDDLVTRETSGTRMVRLKSLITNQSELTRWKQIPCLVMLFRAIY